MMYISNNNRPQRTLLVSLMLAFSAAGAFALDLYPDDFVESAAVNGDGNSNVEDPVSYNNRLYFRADSAATGSELWSIDENDNLRLELDLDEGEASSSVDYVTVFQNKICFRGDDGTVGSIWCYDPTDGSVVQVPGPNGRFLFVWNNKLFWNGEGDDGWEPWVWDGNNASQVANLNSDVGSDGSYPYGWTDYQGRLYFRADNGAANGDEVFVYDGSNTPTLLADVNDGGSSSDPGDLFVFNNKLYWAADDGSTGQELWVYDGENSPSRVADINAGEGDGALPCTSDSNFSGFVEYNNKMYFRGNDGTNGRELFVYDGVNAPQMVVDIRPGENSSSPCDLIVFKDLLFFHAEDENTGEEVWVYDEVNGARLLKDVNAGSDDSDPEYPAVLGNSLFWEVEKTSGARVLFKLSWPDRDGDGVRDEDDAYPDDPTRWALQVPVMPAIVLLLLAVLLSLLGLRRLRV